MSFAKGSKIGPRTLDLSPFDFQACNPAVDLLSPIGWQHLHREDESAVPTTIIAQTILTLTMLTYR